MSELIEGKVARISSDRELIINRGVEHGVDLSMIFLVKGQPDKIVDPDTEEVLGEVEPVKVVVRVEAVDTKFAIARTFRTRRVMTDAGDPGNPMGRASAYLSLARQLQPPRPPTYETRTETLRLDPSKNRPLSPSDSAVNVGDRVVQLGEGQDVDQMTFTVFR